MFIAYIIIAVVMALLLVFSGVAKLRQDRRIVHGVHEVVGVPMRFLPWLAICEFAGALGLLIGIAWGPLGIAAAIGVVLYFIGANIGHIRVGDFKGTTGALVFFVVAVVLLMLRILSLSQELFHF